MTKNNFFKEDDRNKPPDKAVKINTKANKLIKNIDLEPSSYADYSIEKIDAKLADIEKELRQEYGDDLFGHIPTKPKGTKRRPVKPKGFLRKPAKPKAVKRKPKPKISKLKAVKPKAVKPKAVKPKAVKSKGHQVKTYVQQNPKKNQLTAAQKQAISQLYEKYKREYRSIKIALKSIVNNKYRSDIIEILSNVAKNMGQIVTHTYNFIKLYTAYTIKENDEVLNITEEDVRKIMMIIGQPSKKGNGNSVKSKLFNNFKEFYDNHYSKTLPDNYTKPSSTNLSQMITNESRKIVTCISNHIQEHFESLLNQYINILMNKKELEIRPITETERTLRDLENMFGKNSKIVNDFKSDHKEMTGDQIKIVDMVFANDPNVIDSIHDRSLLSDKGRRKSDKEHRKFIRSELTKIKMDIFYNRTGEDAQADKSYDYIKDYFKDNILKSFVVKGSLSQMASSKTPIQLLVLLIRMSIDGENISRSRLKPGDNQNIKIINALPLRSTMRPMYVTIDTSLLVDLLMSKKITGHDKGEYHRTISKNEDYIWSQFFHTEKDSKIVKPFKLNGYFFDHQIQTDGVGASILMRSNTCIGKSKKKSSGKSGKDHKISGMKKPDWFDTDVYVDDLKEDEKLEFLKKNMVSFDPGESYQITGGNGKVDLIHKVDGNKITYKSDEVKLVHEDGKDKLIHKNGDITLIGENDKIYRKIDMFRYSSKERKFESKEKMYAKNLERLKNVNKVDGKTIAQIESELSVHNHASSIWDNVFNFIKKKNDVNARLSEFYGRVVHRRQVWYSYINHQRTDAKMVARFEKKYGGPDKTYITIGNWSQKRILKGHTAVKGKSLRQLFTRRGYRVLLVDEYRTSRWLYKTGEKLTNVIKTKTGRWVHSILGNKYLKLEKYMTPEDLKISRQKNKRPTIINRDICGYQNIGYRARCILKGKDEPEYLKRSNNSTSGKHKPIDKIQLPEKSKSPGNSINQQKDLKAEIKKEVIRKKRVIRAAIRSESNNLRTENRLSKIAVTFK